ncbi:MULTISPECIES: hypothetical protein [unclassified Bradyrhizobium]|uniref:hypothetical protein n=1 Tax=unclassified Bradyrhizobium TaxID=2631580 RepID=UPI002916E039|nr:MULTISPECIES: hypothetical protein [unclassified Bradyrhizobium]
MALGSFLTEMGRLELRMLLVGAMISEEPMEYFFEDYAKLTFGPKITWVKERCAASDTMKNYKVELESIFAEMAVLLKKRNYLTHGETYEESFKGKPRAPYRVGVTKDNIDYLDDFDHAQHGDNVFSIQQVKDATALCVKIRNDLDAIKKVVVDNAEPHVEEANDSPWPVANPSR